MNKEEDVAEEEQLQDKGLSNEIRWYHLRNYDACGAPVTLTYKGQRYFQPIKSNRHYTTGFGGALSISAGLIILGFALYLIYEVSNAGYVAN